MHAKRAERARRTPSYRFCSSRTMPHLSGLGLWEQSNRFVVTFAVNDAFRQKGKRSQERLE
jgi:hypothetical protein